MSDAAIRWDEDEPAAHPADAGLAGVLQELHRLREENRQLAFSLGAFSAFVASRGMLEEAWDYIHRIHQLEQGDGR